MNKCFGIILALIIATILYYLGPILMPFVTAAILAYLADPLVNRLTRMGFPRLVSVIIIFSLLFLIIILCALVLIPLISEQLQSLMENIPAMVAKVQDSFVPWLNEHFGTQDLLSADAIKATIADNWSKAGGAVSWFFKTALHSGMTILEIATFLVITPVVTFYFLRDWDKILFNIRQTLPRRIEPTVVRLAKNCDDVLSAFFRGQLLVMLSLGIIYSIGLTAIGLKVGIIIGFISGLCSIVPYLGFIVGIIVASIASYSQFGTPTHVLFVWVVYLIGQTIEGTLLTPNLVGNRIGLHPVAVIFAILVGGSFFGFFGVLLALPVASVLMVIGRFMYSHYSASRIYK